MSWFALTVSTSRTWTLHWQFTGSHVSLCPHSWASYQLLASFINNPQRTITPRKSFKLFRDKVELVQTSVNAVKFRRTSRPTVVRNSGNLYQFVDNTRHCFWINVVLNWCTFLPQRQKQFKKTVSVPRQYIRHCYQHEFPLFYIDTLFSFCVDWDSVFV